MVFIAVTCSHRRALCTAEVLSVLVKDIRALSIFYYLHHSKQSARVRPQWKRSMRANGDASLLLNAWNINWFLKPQNK
jgi:hypothetical protein